MESLEEKIVFELKNFNFKRNSLSYEYLIEAIKLVTENIIVIRDFQQYVYSPVARKYFTKPQNVLWSINKLITLMYFNTDEDIIETYFNTYMSNKPTTKAFVIGVARKVTFKMNAEKTSMKKYMKPEIAYK